MPRFPAAPEGRISARIPPLVPGLLAAVLAVGVAFTVHAMVPVLPAMTAAVVLGLLAANLPGTGTWTAGRGRAGLDFAGKHLMRAGIVFLGLKVSVMDVLGLGWQSLLLIAGVVLASFAGTYGISRAFRLTRDASLLIATGFSICGASAIGAMAAVRRIRHVDTVLPVALVTLCGTLAIGVLPLLLHPLDLTPEVFGAWTGASVHDVGQVVATAQTAGTGALAIAVVVKLTRVILLAPIVAAAGIHQRAALSRGANAAAWNGAARNGAEPARAAKPLPDIDGADVRMPPIVPLFVIGFVAMVGLRSTGWLSPGWLEAGAALQDVLLGMALFGLGSAVRVQTLLHTGARALLAALAAWLLIAALGLGAAVLIIQPH
ncbi:putative integral membrane protein (TIGR00698 family) [Arthrobacter sp. PvP023]|uniref:YeiH family protein n=1 Tax=Micrococcaceae TaxID=1268 RepID=UPI001AE83CB4|nr:putative sulfate exporter family transporter [Arthrobacter sp. PvP023]MBP1136211.1 putative integral membrane protein (TIGR00698 family) [Arthrobacter sp. PvP023]